MAHPHTYPASSSSSSAASAAVICLLLLCCCCCCPKGSSFVPLLPLPLQHQQPRTSAGVVAVPQQQSTTATSTLIPGRISNHPAALNQKSLFSFAVVSVPRIVLSASSNAQEQEQQQQQDNDDDDDDDDRQAKDLFANTIATAAAATTTTTATTITLESLKQMEFVKELLNDGDLLPDELQEIWNSIDKISNDDDENDDDKIDENGFVQIYKAINDLFEEDDDDNEQGEDIDSEKDEPKSTTTTTLPTTTTTTIRNDENDKELVSIFQSIATKEGALSLDALKEWDEIKNLFSEGLLGPDEFDRLWQSIPKNKKTKQNDANGIDLEGFLAFNAGLDNLFDFEDIDEEDLVMLEETSANIAAEQPATTATAATAAATTRPDMVNDQDLSATELFHALADKDGRIGKDELQRWGELQEMLADGDLRPSEVERFLDEVTKDADEENKYTLTEAQFVAFYDKIEALFEEDNEEEDEDDDGDDDGNIEQDAIVSTAVATRNVGSGSNVKSDLLSAIDRLNSDQERLPCGLEATEKEQAYIKDLVTALESDPDNIVRQKQGAVKMAEVAGEWDLLYSSSSAMSYNKGLSGLGGSFPNGSFGGLKMKLTASKFLTDVEYVERIKVIPESASFDVVIDGDWQLASSVSIFTGEPSTVLTVVPEKVTYGPTSTKADHWKSLGPTNMLDLSYLDGDLRIMRGNTSTDSILVFRRSK